MSRPIKDQAFELLEHICLYIQKNNEAVDHYRVIHSFIKEKAAQRGISLHPRAIQSRSASMLRFLEKEKYLIRPKWSKKIVIITDPQYVKRFKLY